jgi:hypothetical protein
MTLYPTSYKAGYLAAASRNWLTAGKNNGVLGEKAHHTFEITTC